MKRLLSFILILAMLLSLSCCVLPYPPKTFSVEGMTITLTKEFVKISKEGYVACYATDALVIFVCKEPPSIREEYSTLDAYAEYVHDCFASVNPSQIIKEHGLTFIEFTAMNEEDMSFTYFCPMFKTSKAFWMFLFACDAEDYDTLQGTMIRFAQTITFDA